MGQSRAPPNTALTICIYMAHIELLTSVTTVNNTSSAPDSIVSNSIYFYLYDQLRMLCILLPWYFSEDQEHAWKLKLSVQTLVANILTQLLQQFYGSVQHSGSFSRTTDLDIWIVRCILHLSTGMREYFKVSEKLLSSGGQDEIYRIKQDSLLALVLQV